MRVLILFLFLIFTVNAFSASELKSVALPLLQNGDRAFLQAAVLGPVCSGLRSLKKSPACNPSMLGENQEEGSSVFGANVFGGTDWDLYRRNQDILAEKDKSALAQSLLAETKPVRAEGSVLLWWRGETLAVSYQPFRVAYFSSVRNQSYPDLSLLGVQEQSLQVQAGGFVTDNWRFGLQARGLDRRFVYEDFNVFTALPELEQKFQVRRQKALFLEPGLAYEMNQTEEFRQWRPLFSLNISQLGWVDKSYDEIPIQPLSDFGLSVSPPVSEGDLEVGLNYRWTVQTSLERRIRLGSVYKWAGLELTGGIDADQWGLGASTEIFKSRLGLMYQRSQISQSGGLKSFDESTFLEFRMTL